MRGFAVKSSTSERISCTAFNRNCVLRVSVYISSLCQNGKHPEVLSACVKSMSVRWAGFYALEEYGRGESGVIWWNNTYLDLTSPLLSFLGCSSSAELNNRAPGKLSGSGVSGLGRPGLSYDRNTTVTIWEIGSPSHPLQGFPSIFMRPRGLHS